VKPALKLGVHQQLTLTPQLKQAIRLLQLSAVELETEIREVLESNPLLEREDEAQAEAAPDGAGNGAAEPGPEAAPAEITEAEPPAKTEEAADSGEPEFDAVADEGLWDGVSRKQYDDAEPIEMRTAAPESLHDYLAWQLNLTPLSDRDHAIAEALIEAVDDDGYLREDLEAIRQALAPDIDAAHDEIEAVRHRLQHFDPIGVASRSLGECLAVQLALLPADTPHLALARQLATSHLEALAKDAQRLAVKLEVSADELAAAAALLKTLNPRPGNAVGAQSTEYVVPDAYAYKQDGRWKVRVNPACQPTLAINRHYEQLAAASRGEDGSYLRGRLQEARWLIKSLAARGETMLKVASCIVRQQSAFLDYGPEAMRPLTLREVADEVGVHESTVSRITTRKYLHTPRGTFEFKHFFSVGLATHEGGEASATAIRAMIKKLVDDEDPRRPMSDQAIAGELSRRGIAVARRTVAKYREAMSIPASSDRCRLG
jgi:RNA polymerase sigma-54 factor